MSRTGRCAINNAALSVAGDFASACNLDYGVTGIALRVLDPRRSRGRVLSPSSLWSAVYSSSLPISPLDVAHPVKHIQIAYKINVPPSLGGTAHRSPTSFLATDTIFAHLRIKEELGFVEAAIQPIATSLCRC